MINDLSGCERTRRPFRQGVQTTCLFFLGQAAFTGCDGQKLLSRRAPALAAARFDLPGGRNPGPASARDIPHRASAWFGLNPEPSCFRRFHADPAEIWTMIEGLRPKTCPSGVLLDRGCFLSLELPLTSDLSCRVDPEAPNDYTIPR
jgi:hypothetical protein